MVDATHRSPPDHANAAAAAEQAACRCSAERPGWGDHRSGRVTWVADAEGHGPRRTRTNALPYHRPPVAGHLPALADRPAGPVSTPRLRITGSLDVDPHPGPYAYAGGADHDDHSTDVLLTQDSAVPTLRPSWTGRATRRRGDRHCRRRVLLGPDGRHRGRVLPGPRSAMPDVGHPAVAWTARRRRCRSSSYPWARRPAAVQLLVAVDQLGWSAQHAKNHSPVPGRRCRRCR